MTSGEDIVKDLGDVSVPVVEVTAGNMHDVWPSLIHSVKYSSFIALDLVNC